MDKNRPGITEYDLSVLDNEDLLRIWNNPADHNPDTVLLAGKLLREHGVTPPPGHADALEAANKAAVEAAQKEAAKPPVPRYELKLPDGTLRQITGAEDLRDELVDGRIPGDMPCRHIAKPGKGGVVKEAAWGTIAGVIGRTGFEGRVLFRPVWAHTIAGLGIGVVTGFAAWLLLDVFNTLSAALQLSGPQYNNRGHAIATRFAAFAIVCMFWFLSGALPMLAAILRVDWLKKLAATASARAFQLGIGGLIVEAMKVVHRGLGCEAGVAKPTSHCPERRMNIHKNARLTPQGRLLMVRRIGEEGWRVADAAAAAGLSVRRAYHWLARYRVGGAVALHDRSSTPARYRDRAPNARDGEIERLRRQRMTGARIARQLGLPRSTVGAVLRRLGLGRLKALDPPPPIVRYQRERPGELLHPDTKKLGRIDGVGHRITGYREGVHRSRGIGWEVLHVAIDDASRLAYTELLPDEKKESAIAFLDRALAWFARLGVGVERVMTDNGSAYRSHAFRGRLAQAAIRHIRTRPYTPKTNGKAERFIQTSLREWAYARAYHSSAERGRAMHPWIADYNHTRPHSALGGRPPLEKLNNVLGFNT